MKKSVFYLMIVAMTMTASPGFANEIGKEPTALTTETENAARAKVLISRLEEIKAMDKSDMSRSEKKELRKEVKTIKTELRNTGNGVYLSIGAIIIIILLLILLL